MRPMAVRLTAKVRSGRKDLPNIVRGYTLLTQVRRAGENSGLRSRIRMKLRAIDGRNPVGNGIEWIWWPFSIGQRAKKILPDLPLNSEEFRKTLHSYEFSDGKFSSAAHVTVHASERNLRKRPQINTNLHG